MSAKAIVYSPQLTSKRVKSFLWPQQSQPIFKLTSKVLGNKHSTFILIDLQTFGYLRCDVILATAHLE